MDDAAIRVRDLTFHYQPDLPPALDRVSLDVQPGWRCLLIGANGAGKSTLLRILAGQHMVDAEVARVLGRSAFHDVSLTHEVTFLGGRFPFEADVPVSRLVDGVRRFDSALRERLIGILGVDPSWRMHQLSSGQRRRVQILLGLLRQPRVLLLDEVTTDLDVIARHDLLAYLREQSEQGVTILYATHILGSLGTWASHLAYLVHGQVRLVQPLDAIEELAELRAAHTPSPLLTLVDRWLRRDR